MDKSIAIKNGLRNSFQSESPKMANRKCYGYISQENSLYINYAEAHIVSLIFERYLRGDSLVGIANLLNEKNIPSPSGDNWSMATIDKILSNEKYTGNVILQKTVIDNGRQIRNYAANQHIDLPNHHDAIITQEVFEAVQKEKAARSAYSPDLADIAIRHRHNSQNILNCLLKCAECGSSFRRITRYKDGNKIFVWRCANRVEHGKSVCKSSPTLYEATIKADLCRKLAISNFSENTIRLHVNNIQVHKSGALEVDCK